MTIIKQIAAWIWFSSKDSSKVSLTVKSIGLGLVTILTIAAGMAQVSIPSSTDLSQIVDSVVALVQGILMVVSLGGTVWGLVRKIYLTMRGENDVPPSLVG